MKRKIRPAEEEMGNVAFLILFAILWYACLIASLVNGGTRMTVLLFFVAGLFPVYSAVTMMRKALFYRRQRADAIAYGSSRFGKIRSVMGSMFLTVRENITHSDITDIIIFKWISQIRSQESQVRSGVRDTENRSTGISLPHRYASIQTGAGGSIIWRIFSTKNG